MSCSSYLAFQQVPDLLLDTLALSQQALVDGQALKPTFAAADIVDFGGAILNGATQEVLGVRPDVVALSLDCYTWVSVCLLSKEGAIGQHMTRRDNRWCCHCARRLVSLHVPSVNELIASFR